MGKSAPKAPDPEKTAAAQAGLNRDTAITQQQLNMVNQVGPDGSLTYNQTGTGTFVDSKGNIVKTPTYTATTTLSPQQQLIKNQTDAASLNLATLANNQSKAIGDQLSKPFEFNNSDAEQWAYDLASPRILQQQGKNEATLRSQLIASGIRPGSAQWDSEMSRLTNANTDQLNQLALTGRQQAYQEALTEYNNPLNSISALMSGSQVQNPQFVNTPTSQVGGVDYSGLVQQNYQNKMNQYNSQTGALGGLFSLAGKTIFSDRRLKKDIISLGEKNGLPWYGFRYIWESAISPLRQGLMAQDMLKLRPDSVVMDESGYMAVDYDRALGGA